ncbi:MAG: class I SAM-dependent methyltransferase [Candidatus Woesearchaeota archaeon]
MGYYSDIAEGYDELHREEQIKKLKLLAKHFKPKGRMLDIGAGTGISTSFFNNVDAVALDPSEDMLNHFDGEKAIGDAEHLPFPDKSFDSIISVTALHHVKNVGKAAAEIMRVAKDDAAFAFTILKKAKNSEELREKLKKIFDLEEIEEEKDYILFSRTYC